MQTPEDQEDPLEVGSTRNTIQYNDECYLNRVSISELPDLWIILKFKI